MRRGSQAPLALDIRHSHLQLYGRSPLNAARDASLLWRSQAVALWDEVASSASARIGKFNFTWATADAYSVPEYEEWADNAA
jgi:hypothetical protein